MIREHRPDVVLELSHTAPGWTFCLGDGLRWPCPSAAEVLQRGWLS